MRPCTAGSVIFCLHSKLSCSERWAELNLSPPNCYLAIWPQPLGSHARLSMGWLLFNDTAFHWSLEQLPSYSALAEAQSCLPALGLFRAHLETGHGFSLQKTFSCRGLSAARSSRIL